MSISNRTLMCLSILFICLFDVQTGIEPETILGFNPRVSHIPASHTTTKTPVITVLGFPDPITMYAGKFDTKNTFTVTFAFHNNLAFTAAITDPSTIINSYKSINVGQELDGQTLLYVVVECYKKGYKKVDIFANSRGGGATISMLDMLSNPLEHFDIWRSLGITRLQTIEAIRAMVGRGTVFLAHPVMDQNIAMRNSIGNKINHLWPFFGNEALKNCAYHSLKKLLTWTTRYNANYPTPLHIINNNIYRASWPYQITIALAYHDEVVGHNHDRVLCNFAHYYPKKIILKPGGRNHYDIRKLVKDFRLSLHDAQSIS